MRLTINGDLQRSEVFRSQDDVLTAGETWKQAMIEKGWRLEAANGTNTPPIRRQIGWSGASAITFGIAIVEFVKEILLGRTVTQATYECSVYLVGGLIYLQAKRWERTIGRPDIQQFAGALQGQRARKGVFITTSSFSADAKQYAERIDTRIILIDGTELARLMIAHGVGVTPVAVYELKRVDSDFFAEE